MYHVTLTGWCLVDDRHGMVVVGNVVLGSLSDFERRKAESVDLLTFHCDHVCR